MGHNSVKTVTAPAIRLALLEVLQGHEKILLCFFVYLAGLAVLTPLPSTHQLAIVLETVAVYSLFWMEAQISRPSTRILREWLTLALILLAYWTIQLFAGDHTTRYMHLWSSWDSTLLMDFGLQPAIESLGPVLPNLLETCYLLLYAIPPFALGMLYLNGLRQHADRFLTMLLLGTLTAYALLPLFPVESPRLAFPGLNQPHFSGWARAFNVYVLDHLDISTSVFPSGHVAVAFSSAFGLLLAAPAKRWLWLSVFVLATLIFIATIYGRYHYAVDGLLSILLTSLAFIVLRRLDTHAA
jgi:membrane-associated phospholipid phosphatase